MAAQTTQAIEKVRHLVALILDRFPQWAVRFLDTVCKPTKERQSAAVEMARQADVVIVVGGRGSNNTRELVKTCARYCARVHHVQTDADVCPEWFDAATVVGLTAGTSTPDDVDDRVEARIPPSRRRYGATGPPSRRRFRLRFSFGWNKSAASRFAFAKTLPPLAPASEQSERATRPERAGEAASEGACRGVRGAKPLGTR